MIYASLNAKKVTTSTQQLLILHLNFLQSQRQLSFQQEDMNLMEITFLFLFRIRQQLQLRISVQKVTEIILISSIFSQEKKFRDMHHFFQELQVKSQLVKTISFMRQQRMSSSLHYILVNLQYTLLMLSTALIVQWMSLLISIRQLLRLRKVLLSNWNS